MVLRIKYLDFNDFINEKNNVICLGYFDGMHIAHMKLISEARKIAKEKELPLAVLTFTTNIKAFLNHERHRCLTTIEDKAEICKQAEVDYLYVIKVSNHLVSMSAQEFISRFLNGANTVVVGFDFRFGYHGAGDRQLLKQCKEFQTIVIPQMKYLDLKVGSTRIKANLQDGKLALANILLGRHYKISGRVVSGRGVGKKLGFPTANIDYMPYVLPKSGVYFSKVIHKDRVYHSLTNVGNNPTYFNVPLTVETYIMDLDEYLYNEIIEIQFIKYLREEIKFSSEEELRLKILDDVEIAKKIIEEEYS